MSGISWGIYVRFGRIRLTKTFRSLHQARQRYNSLLSRKKRHDTWFALVQIENKMIGES